MTYYYIIRQIKKRSPFQSLIRGSKRIFEPESNVSASMEKIYESGSRGAYDSMISDWSALNEDMLEALAEYEEEDASTPSLT